MGAIVGLDFGTSELVYYGEVIQEDPFNLIDARNISVASATSLALSEDGQERLFSDIERYAEHLVTRPADVSNNPEVTNRFGVIGVNSALEVDLYGHVNSTYLNGTHLINGTGESSDFNRNSTVFVTTLPFVTGSGDTSRIVPMFSHVDHTEHAIDMIVTEQGVVDLRGLPPQERARKILNECAHPAYRSELRDYLQGAADGHIPHDLESTLTWNQWRGW